MVGLTGIVLAAGAGSRMGEPKALLSSAGIPWVRLSTELLFAAGCDRVVVVLGAQAGAATPLVPASADVVVASDWASGLSASLRAGLVAATGTAALITLVDLPELPVAAALRLASGFSPSSLQQAIYDGRPGHPVLIGSEHWGPLASSLSGDRGARAYLSAHGVTEIECADLFHGRDVDTPAPAPGSPEAAEAAVLAIAAGAHPTWEALQLANAYTDGLSARGLARLRGWFRR